LSVLLSNPARELLDAFASDPERPLRGHRAEIELLDRELVLGRRLLVGGASLLVVLLGALALTVAATPDVGPAAAMLSGLLGLALVVAGAVVGHRVVRTGRRLLRAYLAWTAADTADVSPFSIPARLLSGPGIARSALAAFALLAAVFAWAFVYLGLAPGDPGELGDGREAMAVLGLVSGTAFSVAAWCLLAGEIRAGLGHSGRVVRSRG
jgi:hypothetical protein